MAIAIPAILVSPPLKVFPPTLVGEDCSGVEAVSGAVMTAITGRLQRIWRAAASKQEEERAEVEILSEETRRRLKLR